MNTRTDRDYDNTMRLFKESLKMDPNLALTLIGMGESYYTRNHFREYFEEDPMDSVLMWCKQALEIDPNLADAYQLRAKYYNYVEGCGQRSRADIQTALDLDPNHAESYRFLGTRYRDAGDYPEALRNYKKALTLVRGQERTSLNKTLAWFYLTLGDFDRARSIWNGILRLDPDNLSAIDFLAHLERCLGNSSKNLDRVEKMIALDQSGSNSTPIALVYMMNGKYEEAEKYFAIHHALDSNKMSLIHFDDLHMYSYVLDKNGKSAEAAARRDQAYDYLTTIVNLERPRARSIGYEMAKVYALKGEKEEALKWLRHYEDYGFRVGLHEFAHYDPPFETLWGDPEFEAILQRATERIAGERAKIADLDREGLL